MAIPVQVVRITQLVAVVMKGVMLNRPDTFRVGLIMIVVEVCGQFLDMRTVLGRCTEELVNVVSPREVSLQ